MAGFDGVRKALPIDRIETRVRQEAIEEGGPTILRARSLSRADGSQRAVKVTRAPAR